MTWQNKILNVLFSFYHNKSLVFEIAHKFSKLIIFCCCSCCYNCSIFIEDTSKEEAVDFVL